MDWQKNNKGFYTFTEDKILSKSTELNEYLNLAKTKQLVDQQVALFPIKKVGMRFGYNLGCGVIKEIVNYKSFSNGQASHQLPCQKN